MNRITKAQFEFHGLGRIGDSPTPGPQSERQHSLIASGMIGCNPGCDRQDTMRSHDTMD